MTASAFKSWLLTHGFGHASGVNRGQIDYRRVREATGYSVSALKAMVYGARKVGPRLLATLMALESPRSPAG